MSALFDFDFYRGRRVFVTGHTGFKGSWLCHILKRAGATVTGYSLPPPTTPSLFALARVERGMTSVIGDILDLDALLAAFTAARPEIVFHLAAQPLVREGYRDPVATYAANVMGTVHVLECVRRVGGVRSFLNVTTDKVYLNREWPWGYREEDTLGGDDPYASSKACAELITRAFRRSYFADGSVALSTARAGNVIGGGDFAPHRILPDCLRAAAAGEDILLRSPHSVRPYQHLLEPLFAYLMIAARQYENSALAGCYNVGPDESDCSTTGALADLFIKAWGGGIRRIDRGDGGPHESRFLKLDASRLKDTFGWRPTLSLSAAVGLTVDFHKALSTGEGAEDLMDRQIAAFISKQQGV